MAAKTIKILLLVVAFVAIGLADAAAQTTGDQAPDAEPERSETADTTHARSIIVRVPIADSTRIDTVRVRSPKPRTTLNQQMLRRRRHSMDVKIAEVRRDSVFLSVLEHLRHERFDAAREQLDSIGGQARDATVRMVAAFDRVEIDFFTGDFTTAREGYKAFGQSHRRGYLANDALARVFLIDDNSDRMQAPLRLFARAELFSRVGAADSAMSTCHATLTRFPDCELRDDLNLRLGDLSLQTAAPGDALHFYRTVCDTIPDSSLGATALMRIGHYHEVIERDIPAAIQAYEEVLERYPESLETPEARKILDGLRRRTVVPVRGRTEKET